MDIGKILKEMQERSANNGGIRVIVRWVKQRSLKVGDVISDKDIILLIATTAQKKDEILNGLKTLEDNGYFENKNDGRALTRKWNKLL